MDTICVICKKIFHVKPSRFKRGNVRCCSFECKNIYKKGIPSPNKGKKGHPCPQWKKDKQRITMLGENNPAKRPEVRAKISLKAFAQKGKTPEVHKKQGETMKELYRSGKLIHPRIGKKDGQKSEEWKRKIGDKMRGDKCHLWKGGISFEPYSVDWTRTLKRSIRERDKYTCQICEKEQEDRAFDVHHIDYNKKNCNPTNLITLCKSCHSKTSQNRNYWIDFFNKLLV
jgi:hypothetical protein